MKTLIAFLVAVAVTVPAYAEPRIQLPTTGERRAADIASWVTVVTAIALDTKASYDCPQRLHCFEMQGVRAGVTYGAVGLTKWLVHRDRPCAPACGIDGANQSFFSGHTAIAFSSVGGARLAFSLPLAIGTGGLRVAAGKHWATDTIVGGLVGLATSRIR